MASLFSPVRSRLLVTRILPLAVEERMRQEFEVQRPPGVPGRVLTEDELLAAAVGCEALLITPRDHLSASVIQHLPASVRAAATYSVGLDHIDLPAARQRGLAVFHTPGVLDEATADLTMLLLLGAARHAATGERLVRSGGWGVQRPDDLLGLSLSGRTLGIVGLGRIGQAVARRARGFGMEIHYCNRRRLEPALEQGASFHSSVEDLLPVSRFLSLHCPASPATEGLLNARTLALLPTGAVVVNTARGTLVVDEDLIAALRSGHLYAAGLDVFRGEPALHPDYRELPNVFLLPHLGSATVETRDAMGFLALDNLRAFLAGEPTPTRVV